MNTRFDCKMLEELETFLEAEKNKTQDEGRIIKILVVLEKIADWKEGKTEDASFIDFTAWSTHLRGLAKRLQLPFSVLSQLPRDYIDRLGLLEPHLKKGDETTGLSISQALSSSNPQAMMNLRSLASLIKTGKSTYQEICGLSEDERQVKLDKLLAPKPQA